MAQLARKRFAFIAALMNLFFPGLGFLYSGAWWLAVALPLLLLGLVLLFAWQEWVLTASGLHLLIILLLLLMLFGVLLGALSAWKRSPAVLKSYQRWYVYLALMVLFAGFNFWFAHSRADLLGYETFRVPSSSMEPTLLPNDFLVADTNIYDEHSPQPGDVIVFHKPDQPDQMFTKRVVAIPGNRVKLSRGELYIDGERVAQPYIDQDNNKRSGLLSTAELLIPENAYFVLGDNRDNSQDSRHFGLVSQRHLHGKVTAVWFSLDTTRSAIRWSRMDSL